MYFVVCYDISNNRRRHRLEKALLKFGQRVQESVFETDLNEKEYIEMQEAVARVINMEEDNVRFYRQCKSCKSAIDVMGVGTFPTDGPKVMVV